LFDLVIDVLHKIIQNAQKNGYLLEL
jgi:hypothetical protein